MFLVLVGRVRSQNGLPLIASYLVSHLRAFTVIRATAFIQSAAFLLCFFTVLLPAGAAVQAPASAQSQSAEARVSQALIFLRLRDLQKAREELRVALQLNPRLEQAHLYLGVVESQLGRLEAAQEHLREALRLNSGSDAAHYNLALVLVRLGKTGEAIEELQAAVRKNPALSDAHYNLGVLLNESGRFAEAASHLERAQKVRPGDSAAAIHLARAYLGSKRTGQAIQILTPLRTEERWQVHYLLGLAYIQSEKPEAAIAELREAVRLKPDDPGSHYSLGTLLLERVEPAEQQSGVQHLEKAIALAPREADSYARLGRWLLQQGKLSRVISLLRGALEQVSPSVDLYLMLGLAEAQAHGAEVARPLIEKAVAMNPKIAPALNLLGNCYFRLGDYGRAAEYYRQALQLNPQNHKYHYDVALALERLNRNAEALPFVQKAVALEPGQGRSHYLLGKVYAKLGRLAEALREFETCVKLEPEAESAYYQLARGYLRLGDQARAQEWNARLLELKGIQDRRVGLSTPASGVNLLELTKPWESLAGEASPEKQLKPAKPSP